MEQISAAVDRAMPADCNLCRSMQAGMMAAVREELTEHLHLARKAEQMFRANILTAFAADTKVRRKFSDARHAILERRIHRVEQAVEKLGSKRR